jgi:hypothetical protein
MTTLTTSRTQFAELLLRLRAKQPQLLAHLGLLQDSCWFVLLHMFVIDHRDECSIEYLVRTTKFSEPSIDRHLAILQDAQLVEIAQAKGSYSLTLHGQEVIGEALASMAQDWRSLPDS